MGRFATRLRQVIRLRHGRDGQGRAGGVDRVGREVGGRDMRGVHAVGAEEAKGGAVISLL